MFNNCRAFTSTIFYLPEVELNNHLIEKENCSFLSSKSSNTWSNLLVHKYDV